MQDGVEVGGLINTTVQTCEPASSRTLYEQVDQIASYSLLNDPVEFEK
jgi:hypothetical protein